MLLQTRRTIPAKLNMLTLDVNKKMPQKKESTKNPSPARCLQQ
jgi:hypothetical protein